MSPRTRIAAILLLSMLAPITPADAHDALPPGAVRHIVFFKWKDGTAQETIDKAVVEFEALKGKVPGILDFEWGVNHSPEGLAKGFTHAFIVTFENAAARDRYLPSDPHKAFVDLALPVIAEVCVMDITPHAAGGGGLRIDSGLEAYRVYQRGPDGKAEISFSGAAGAEGTVEARVTRDLQPVAGLDWTAVGRAAGGKVEGKIAGAPTGGEYAIDVRVRDAAGKTLAQTSVPHVLVGDVWILAGQSNMEGVGDLEDVEAPTPEVHVYTMAHQWEVAQEPLHWLIDSPDPVHSHVARADANTRATERAKARVTRRKGTGLGIPFAKELLRRTGVPVGLIASAHGGTSMQQWDPAGRDKGGETLYGSMYRQVTDAGGKVKGVLWYQGEAEANPEASALYVDRMRGLIAAFRKDFNSPELPFYLVQLGRFAVNQPGDNWNKVQDLQRKIAAEVPATGLAPAVDLPLDDAIHVGTGGLKRLGKRLARIAHRNLYGGKCETGPRLESVKAEDGTTIRVTYSGVNLRLTSPGRVLGFSLRGGDGKEQQIIFNAAVDPARPNTVVLKLSGKLPDGATLWYGAGLDPAANLTDAEDMAAPVFGPVAIGA